MAQRVEVYTPIESLPYPVQQHDRGKWRLGGLSRALLLVALLGGGAAYANTHPQETQDARQYIQSLIDQFHASQIPSQGEIFNPNARSGEISPTNSILLPKDEALQLVQQRTLADQRRYFLLPEGKLGLLNYEVKQSPYGEMTGIWGLTAGTTFVSPYDGFLTWATYENNGAMSINLRKLQPTLSEGTTKQIEYVIQDVRLLFPSELFSTRQIGEPGRRTTYSSEVPVKAGQLIFELTSERVVPGSYTSIGNYQVVINGAKILSIDNKAVLVSA